MNTTVKIPADSVELGGELILPPSASGIVLFAHGSGSSRFSPRNTFVASVLQQQGIGTLLFDLLTRAEDQDYAVRFDIDLLTRRLLAATAWLQTMPETKTLRMGYFGASTGAAAALQAAAERGKAITAVVSRGSSRFSPRNTFVASVLQQQGIGTLLFDLLTRAEDQDYAVRFDIDLLTRRLLAATAWLQTMPETKTLRMGYFGASTGAAAALQAAAERGKAITAVVSRGGRPDLAGEAALNQVTAPTLLIVGSADYGVIELNEQAYALLKCEKDLTLVPGATHLFEEPGTLEQVAQLATSWFLKYFQ